MLLPFQSSGVARERHRSSSTLDHGLHLSGKVENRSTKSIWITADGRRWCLRRGETSESIGLSDGDGVLLDGRRFLFDSLRSDLGGGQVHTQGALKVCNVGTLTVADAVAPGSEFVVTIDAIGFAPCNPLNEWGGYKDQAWCSRNTGWDINSAPVGRQC